MNTYVGQTSRLIYAPEKELAEGGQGYVLKVQVSGQADEEAIRAQQEQTRDHLLQFASGQVREAAVKWYKKSWVTPEQRAQITSLIESGPPHADAEALRFIWPLEMVTTADSEAFGYVMPLIDPRFRDYFAMIEGDFSVPLKVICKVCYQLATALRYVHRIGRCYGDLNFGNIKFDPTSGDIVVLDNDNVVVNSISSGISGVFEFMAPEVALGLTPPNRDSDIFSLAVTFYHLFAWHHPLDGKKTLALYSWDNIAKKKFFAEEPVFVFDANDQSNSTDGVPELEFHTQRWQKLCPPALKQLFTRTFTAGLKEPGRRVQIPNWQRAFLEGEANAVACSCGANTIWSLEPWLCFKCGKTVASPTWLRIQHGYTGDVALPALPGVELRKHHLEPDSLDPADEPTRIAGVIEGHPTVPGQVIIRNRTSSRWQMTTSKGDDVFIEPGAARALAPAAKIQIEGIVCDVNA